VIIDKPSDITRAVLAEIERAPNPRFREIMSTAVRHLHAFIGEAKLTEAEFQQQVMHLARCRLIRFESVHRLPRLSEDVWVGDRAAPDVDGVAARLVESPHRVFRLEDVAAARNRDRDMAFDLAHQVPIGPTLVSLHARSAVQRDHRAAAVLDQLRDLDAVD